jgi:parvulin-like peptidyl-prolyl isomerase
MVLTAAGSILVGCKAVRDMLSARPQFAAEAQGQELPVERLAKIMTSLKGVPLTREAAEFLANMWVDYALFSHALATGRDLTDSATAAQVLWPELSEARGTIWHDSLVSHRASIRPEMADSVYAADSIRVLQHILIAVPARATPEVRAAAHRHADQLYAQVRSGKNFARLATQFSEDSGSKADSGYLPPAPRGKWVTAFDSAGWALTPGATTGIVETPFGYHIIRRPPPAEVRDRLLTFVQNEVGQKIDSVYLDSLGLQKRLRVSPRAPALMRDALTDVDGHRHSTEVLATYEGGALSVGGFLRWMTALGPTWAKDLTGRPDSSVAHFARLIAQNQLLLEQADSAGVAVSREQWMQMVEGYRAQLDTIRNSLGLNAADISDPAASPSDRARASALRLDSFWDGLATSPTKPRPIPGLLAAVLREGGGYRVIPAGLDRTVEVARELKLSADSAALKNRPSHPAPPAGGAGSPPPPPAAGAK